jgi:hypothetical protein
MPKRTLIYHDPTARWALVGSAAGQLDLIDLPAGEAQHAVLVDAQPVQLVDDPAGLMIDVVGEGIQYRELWLAPHRVRGTTLLIAFDVTSGIWHRGREVYTEKRPPFTA